MTSEDPVEDPLMSVQIYLKSKVVTVHLLRFNFGDELVRTADR